ncbi:hypothetical protein DV737_g2842, partial [Chaetothyriales sp. CBS 132003]
MADYRGCIEITAECPVEATLYGYYPNLGISSFFLALFGLLCVVQIVVGTWRRTWTYMIAVAVGTFGEAVGYGGRVVMNHNPWSDAGFKTQICCLVLAPSFLAAGLYVTLKHLVLYCGPEHSRLKARLYPWVFIGCDFGSIVLQGIGGGVASSGDGDDGENKRLHDAGAGLIVAGIAFQVATMSVCGLLMLDYFRRYRRATAKQSGEKTVATGELEETQETVQIRRKFRLFSVAIATAFLTIYIRCIYRLPEMAGGWGNPLMREQTEFLVLDGMMIAIASTLMTVFHPGFFFPPMRAFKKSSQHQTISSTE